MLPADKSIRTFLSSERTEKRSVPRWGVADGLDPSSSFFVLWEYGGAVNLTDYDAGPCIVINRNAFNDLQLLVGISYMPIDSNARLNFLPTLSLSKINAKTKRKTACTLNTND